MGIVEVTGIIVTRKGLPCQNDAEFTCLSVYTMHMPLHHALSPTVISVVRSCRLNFWSLHVDLLNAGGCGAGAAAQTRHGRAPQDQRRQDSFGLCE
eukprot:scaffold87259_cov21-Tisochrysis_lutea.AAC.1